MKNLTNFYCDNEVKEKVNNKIERLAGKKEKGQFSAMIRVLLNYFLHLPDDSKIVNTLIECLDAEYTYSQTKNKRSNL